MRQRGNVPALVFALTVAIAGGGAAASAAPARAPTSEEQKAFADGLRAYEGGDARGAERAWKAGYAVAHDPAFLVRIGEAQEKAGAPKEAVQSYEQYLRESPDAADRADIEGRVHRLAPQSPARAPVEVETPGELGGQSAAPGAAAPASSPAGSAPAAGTVAAPPGPPGTSLQARDENEDLKPIIEDESARTPLNVAAWVGTGITAALIGTAAFFGAAASERAGDANRLLLYFDKDTGVPQEYAVNAQQFENDVRVGQRDDRLAKAFAIAAGAAAITSAVLFVLDARAEKPARRVAAGGSGRRAVPPLQFKVAPTGLGWSF